MDAKDAYERADMVYKVKEILPEEYRYMRKDLIVFTYIHSNGSREQTDVCLKAGVTGIAYEDVIDRAGKFPLLRPMSEIAGKGCFLAAWNSPRAPMVDADVSMQSWTDSPPPESPSSVPAVPASARRSWPPAAATWSRWWISTTTASSTRR